MEDRFTITLAEGITMEVRPIWERNSITAFGVYSEGKYTGEVYPDSNDAFIEWKSHDNMDSVVVGMIGRAIDKYYAA